MARRRTFKQYSKEEDQFLVENYSSLEPLHLPLLNRKWGNLYNE